MQTITIEISDDAAEKIIDHINSRRDFKLDGGTVNLDHRKIHLRGITFEFFHHHMSEATPRLESELLNAAAAQREEG